MDYSEMTSGLERHIRDYSEMTSGSFPPIPLSARFAPISLSGWIKVYTIWDISNVISPNKEINYEYSSGGGGYSSKCLASLLKILYMDVLGLMPVNIEVDGQKTRTVTYFVDIVNKLVLNLTTCKALPRPLKTVMKWRVGDKYLRPVEKMLLRMRLKRIARRPSRIDMKRSL